MYYSFLGTTGREGLAMIAAARESGKPFGAVFQQRTNPLYQQIREIIQSKKYGELKRVNWVVTDWYRPDSYYTSAPWRATWATDGGGVLLNQCPHNLDLLQWMCGMPARVQAFCHAGRFHPIEEQDFARQVEGHLRRLSGR